MRPADTIALRPIAGRRAALTDVAGRAARLVLGRRPGPRRVETSRVDGPRHLVFVWKVSVDGDAWRQTVAWYSPSIRVRG
jgi:hypothetical protein